MKKQLIVAVALALLVSIVAINSAQAYNRCGSKCIPKTKNCAGSHYTGGSGRCVR